MTKRKKHLKPVEPAAVAAQEAADAERPDRWLKFLWILPLLAAFVFNLAVLDNGYVWDDYNLFERQLPNIRTVKDAFFPGEKVPELFGAKYFRPFTLLSYKTDKALWGHNVKGYHFNVLLSHCLNTVLVYFLALLAASGLRSRYSMALFSAALFAVHPVHAEVVAWICGRNESLSTNFALLAVVLYALCRKKDSMLWLSLSCLCFLIGLFFKELAAAVLFLIPLYDLCFYRKNYSPLTKKNENVSVYALFAATFFLYYIVRKMSLGGFGLQSFIEEMNLVKAVISTLGYYLKVTVLPLELDYFISEIPSSNIYFLCSALALAGLLFIAVKSFFDDKRIVTFGILSFLVILAPSLAVAITYISETPLALRYLYFPSVGFVILLGYLLRVDRIGFSSKVPFGQKIKCALFLFIFIFYQYVNAGQILIWKDDISLWSSVTQKTPEAGLPHSELGRAYILAGRPQEAIEEYKKALAMKYDNEGKSIAANALGYIYLQSEDLDEAESWYKKAMEFRPADYPLPYYNLGYLWLRREELLINAYPDPQSFQRREKVEKAILLFQKAIEINPHYYKAHYFLGMSFLKLGQKDRAKAQFRRLIELDPPGEWADNARRILSQFQ